MNLKPFPPPQQMDDRDEHSAESHAMWIALGSVLAVVLAMVIILTLVGGGSADAALLGR